MIALLTLMAMATPTAEQQAAYTGVFVPAESDAVLDARWDAEVDRVLPSVSWIKRGIARLALKGKRPPCTRLFLATTDESFSVQCDDQDELVEAWGTRTGSRTNDRGDTVDVDLRMEDGAVRFDLESARGRIESTYVVLDDGQITLTTSTYTKHASEPFRWHQTFRRE